MIEVYAELWYWTPEGMRRDAPGGQAYVRREEVERLLEEADRRRLDWTREQST